jgi:uncharacterized protein (DUF924 family)
VSADPEEIVDFWFGSRPLSADGLAARAAGWFQPDPAFDAEIARRFGELPERAVAGGLDAWAAEPRSALARVLVLDQFPRNLFRGSPRSFAFDAVGLQAASAAVDSSFHERLHAVEASFLFIPFEHAEDLAMQDRCIALFEQLCATCDDSVRPQVENFRGYADRHRTVIRRFGRFPHRNALLGRECTPEEDQYLGGGGETFGDGK